MMAEESKKQPKKSGKSGKRRYFRRRKKGAKGGGSSSGSKPATAQAAPEKPKKQRGKRRRSGRRRRQQQAAPPVEILQGVEETHDEPVDVYVYTHTIRPAYRDYMGDYVPEHSLQFGDRKPEEPIGMEHLRAQIRAELDEKLERALTLPRPVSLADFEDDEDEDEE